MRLAHIRWRDAVAEGGDLSTAPHAALVELEEVGFLLDENEEAVVIGMERHAAADVMPGRWRLHIPRVSIVEMRVAEVEAAFAVRPKRKRGNGNG